jgi:hypothetical protein
METKINESQFINYCLIHSKLINCDNTFENNQCKKIIIHNINSDDNITLEKKFKKLSEVILDNSYENDLESIKNILNYYISVPLLDTHNISNIITNYISNESYVKEANKTLVDLFLVLSEGYSISESIEKIKLDFINKITIYDFPSDIQKKIGSCLKKNIICFKSKLCTLSFMLDYSHCIEPNIIMYDKLVEGLSLSKEKINLYQVCKEILRDPSRNFFGMDIDFTQ